MDGRERASRQSVEVIKRWGIAKREATFKVTSLLLLLD
jgi:hypothetical protein